MDAIDRNDAYTVTSLDDLAKIYDMFWATKLGPKGSSFVDS
jgi:hypothetical protein